MVPDVQARNPVEVPVASRSDLPDVQVLFCGEEFERGFRYTQSACSSLPGVQVVRCPRPMIEEHIAAADVLVPLMSRLDSTVLQKACKAKLILQFGVGLEGVDILKATELQMHVSNIPSLQCGNALSCAEMAIYLMLTCLRQAREMELSIRNRVLGLPLGQALFGKTCLVVGFGNIARELIPRLKPFGVRIVGVRQSAWGGDPEGAKLEGQLDKRGSWTQLHEFAAEADIIVLTCTQTPATRGTVGRALLSACRPGLVIINVARGGLLDYDAVKDGLESGRIGALGLDVQWQEPIDPHDYFAQHPRVYLTPHVAGVTELSYRRMAQTVASEVKRFQHGLPPTVRINASSHQSSNGQVAIGENKDSSCQRQSVQPS